MFTKKQLEIIKAVGMVLREDTDQRVYYRIKDPTPDGKVVAGAGWYFKYDKEQKFCLYITKIGEQECLGLDRFGYSNYSGNFDIYDTIGYVVLGDEDSDVELMYKYCNAIEHMIENGC